ncbi:nitroreductase family protein [Actinotalea sp. Marseille-Q4924]|uniref:nitroreductase family protein n=1 Tax=Actinotalea sp. Marseille-Q4924 TaxID=2866571 RepID=UPI001CE3E966|nr:nitroreductase family protein [Actinotalea sp. Marseille-Q4924]
MELREVVVRRRMVRSFTEDPVPREAVDRVLEHAVRAPSAGFSQGWAFLVLDAPDDVARFWAATTPPSRAAAPDRWLLGMRRAPVVVVPLARESAYRERYAEPDKARGGEPQEPRERWAVPYWYVDAGMASLLMLLTAVDEGLGACFFGVPASRVAALRAEFGVPDDHEPVGAIAIGHPAADQAVRGSGGRRRRRPVEEVVHRGGW